jgi:hypothetical protein
LLCFALHCRTAPHGTILYRTVLYRTILWYETFIIPVSSPLENMIS